MDKKQAVKILGLTADILELLNENEFRILAYRKAERMLDRWNGDWDAALEQGLKHVTGIGSQLGAQLVNRANTGVFAPLEDASALVPPGVLELLKVRGLGPKKVRALWDAGLVSISSFIEAARAGRVATLNGFGAGTQAKLLEAAEFALKSKERHHADAADHAFVALCAQLEGVVSRIEMVGSARRGLETMSNLDVVVLGEFEDVVDALEAFEASSEPESPWLIQAQITGMTVQIVVSNIEKFGASVLMMTGSQVFLDLIQERALGKDLECSVQGIFKNGALVPTLSEQDAFKVLGLEYVIPEWREAEHVQWLDRPDLTQLVSLNQMRGMLHVHSTHSDGANTVREMALGAKAHGANYLGLCDHSQFAFYANGLTPQRVQAQWAEIDLLNAELDGFKILKGIECDILSDGALDYDDELLSGFDFVVASVHSSFTLSESAQTQRLIRAVSNPFTTILGHPTGRLLLRRQEYAFNHEALLEAAESCGAIIEINANPYRLDLDWREALRWRSRLKFAINTDAHVIAGFDDLQYGVRSARKAGLETNQVVNTWSVERFLNYAKAKREGHTLEH